MPIPPHKRLRVRVRSKQECEFLVIDPHAKNNPSDVSVRIAKRITSRFNQHLTIIMVGNTGTGKSWAAIDLAHKTAIEVAKIKLGRNVTSTSWQKYFNLDHMAIITLDRVTNLLQHMIPNGIYILDDIGVGYSNRDFMKDKNKKMNQIIQTFRTDNTCVIYTVPSKGLIDKVPRELVEWYFEFDRSEQDFKAGLNACKFLDITTLKREGRQLFMYDLIIGADGADQFVRHVAEKPPDLLTVPYEKLRAEIALELRKENAEMIAEGIGAAAAKEKGVGGGLSPSQLRTVEMYVDVTARRSGGMKSNDACDAAGLKASTYQELRRGRTGWFTEYMNEAGLPLTP